MSADDQTPNDNTDTRAEQDAARTRYLDAVHEAGHAVMAALLGVEFLEVVLAGGEDVSLPAVYAGALILSPVEIAFVEQSRLMYTALDEHDVARLWNLAQVAMAGALAEHREDRQDTAGVVSGSAVDWSIAVSLVCLATGAKPSDTAWPNWLLEPPIPDADAVQRLERLSRNAAQGVVAYQSAITRVAQRLLAEGRLRNADVLSALKPAEGEI